MKMFTTIAVATAFLGLAACSNEPAPTEATPAEEAVSAENTTVETDPVVVPSVEGGEEQPK